MERLSRQSERLILDAVSDVVGHVSEGLDPTDAVVKVAAERDLSPNFVNLVVCGYNVGATNHHRESSTSILDKMATFPLAKLEEAMLRLYPKVTEESVKAAAAASVVSDEYGRRPDKVNRYIDQDRAELFKAATAVFEKTAEAAGNMVFEKKVDRSNHILAKKAEVERSRHNAALAKESFIATLGALADHVKMARMTEPERRRLLYVADDRFGDVGKSAVAYALARADNVHKRAPEQFEAKVAAYTATKFETLPIFASAINWNAAPYSLLERCVKAAEKASETRQQHNSFVATTAKDITKMFPTKEAEAVRPTSVLMPSTKEVQATYGGPFLGSLMGNIGARVAPRPTTNLVDSAAEDLDDPEHNEEMRQIRVRAMLQDFLNNDEVLAGYEPDEVFEAFNELSAIAPRVAEQPAAMRSLLRQRLTTGAMQPFEANEVASLEKTLKQTQAPATGTPFSQKASSNVLRKSNSVLMG